MKRVRRFAALTLALCCLLSSNVTPSFSRTKVPQPVVSVEQIPTVIWRNSNVRTRAALLCIHGLTLHKGTYSQFGKRMADEGLVTYAMDVRGFGDWQKVPGAQTVDYDVTCNDVKLVLERIHRENPGLPVFILGESMGGCIALKCAALYPKLVSGLIASVPAGERYKETSTTIKIALHGISRGLDDPFPIGKIILPQATKRSALEQAWSNDPQARLNMSARELIRFDRLMDDNPLYAKQLTSTPVLFIQGCNDKLVRPAGTWNLFDRIPCTERERVFSKSAEHLMFEEGQFTNDDVHFVVDWVNKTMLAHAPKVDPARNSSIASATPGGASGADKKADPIRLDYWIELHRGGTTYRVTNKTSFNSGDEVSFHVIPHENGYAYIMLTEGSSGNQAVLFPSKETGLDNYLHSERDYTLPTKDRLKFDNTPGMERVSIVFSKVPIDARAYLHTNRPAQQIAFVSPDRSGAKDLVPTRMQLSWDDESPDLISPNDAAAQASRRLVKLTDKGGNGVLAVDIALNHT